MQGECYLAAGKRGPSWQGMAACAYACLTGPANGKYIKHGIVRISPVFSNNINPSIAHLDPSRFLGSNPAQKNHSLPTTNSQTHPLYQSINMRTAALIAVASALVSTAMAAPAPGNWKPKGNWGWGHAGAWHGNKGKGKGDDQCLTDEDAAEVANVFQQLIQGYTLELTEEALTEDFVDWSSAVNIIRNRGGEGPNVVNAVTFTSRAEFSANHGKQPNIPFDTLNIFHGCNSTSVRWQTLRSGNGQATEQAAIVSSPCAATSFQAFRKLTSFP
jgi:hypothetical protein